MGTFCRKNGFSLLPYLIETESIKSNGTHIRLQKYEAQHKDSQRSGTLSGNGSVYESGRVSRFNKTLHVFPDIRNSEKEWQNSPRNRLPHLRCEHFQMKSFKELKKLVPPHCWFATTDLNDAYLHIPIADECVQSQRSTPAKRDITAAQQELAVFYNSQMSAAQNAPFIRNTSPEQSYR